MRWAILYCNSYGCRSCCISKRKLIQHNQTEIVSALLNAYIKKCLLQLLMQMNSKDMIPISCWTRTWFIMTLVSHTLTLLIVIHWCQWKIVLWKSFNILFHHKYSIILFSCFCHRYTDSITILSNIAADSCRILTTTDAGHQSSISGFSDIAESQYVLVFVVQFENSLKIASTVSLDTNMHYIFIHLGRIKDLHEIKSAIAFSFSGNSCNICIRCFLLNRKIKHIVNEQWYAGIFSKTNCIFMSVMF